MFLYLICYKKCLIEQLNVRKYQYIIVFVKLIADANMTYVKKYLISNLPNVSVTVEYSCKILYIFHVTLIYFYICESNVISLIIARGPIFLTRLRASFSPGLFCLESFFETNVLNKTCFKHQIKLNMLFF